VAAKYDSEDVKKRDEVLRKFVKRHQQQSVGYATNGGVRRRIFSSEVFDRVLAAETDLESSAALANGQAHD
jgi:hypothetical protein